MASEAATQSPGGAHAWWVLFTAAGASSMALIDGTGVTIALPEIQREFGLHQSELQWVVTAYALTLAAALLTGGRLGDLIGHVRALVFGVVAFATGAGLCALTPNIAVMICGRVVEGIGYVLLAPAATILAMQAFPPEQRGRAIGVYSAIGGLFLMLGPIMAGALIELGSWRAVFFTNVILGAVVLVLLRVVKPTEPMTEGKPFKAGHAGLLMVALTTIIFAVHHTRTWGLASSTTLGLLAVGVALLVWFVHLQTRETNPLLNVAFFRNRTFLGDATVLFCLQFGLIAQAAFLAIYLQEILNFSPLQAGLAMVLLLGPWILMSPVAGMLYDRYGVKVPAVAGMTLAWISFLLQALSFPGRDFIWIAPGMCSWGSGWDSRCRRLIPMPCRARPHRTVARPLACWTRSGNLAVP